MDSRTLIYKQWLNDIRETIGACEICGVKNKAFQFHHIFGNESKSFKICQGATYPIDLVYKELAVCIMVDHSCHQKIHHESLIVPESLIAKVTNKLTSPDPPYGIALYYDLLKA